MSQQRLEIGQGAAQRAGRGEQLALRETPAGPQFERRGARIEQVQSGSLTVHGFGARFEYRGQAIGGLRGFLVPRDQGNVCRQLGFALHQSVAQGADFAPEPVNALSQGNRFVGGHRSARPGKALIRSDLDESESCSDARFDRGRPHQADLLINVLFAAQFEPPTNSLLERLANGGQQVALVVGPEAAVRRGICDSQQRRNGIIHGHVATRPAIEPSRVRDWVCRFDRSLRLNAHPPRAGCLARPENSSMIGRVLHRLLAGRF